MLPESALGQGIPDLDTGSPENMGGEKQSIHTGNTALMHYRNKKVLSQQITYCHLHEQNGTVFHRNTLKESGATHACG
jgi:hypothetical protein